jgi:hypothetical protein
MAILNVPPILGAAGESRGPRKSKPRRTKHEVAIMTRFRFFIFSPPS